MKLIYPKFWQKISIWSYLLLPFSCVYFLLTVIRYIVASPIKLPGAVICIGNVSVGGTGKTQMMITLAKALARNKLPFVMVSKAYGIKLKKATLVSLFHEPEEIGDEAKELSMYGTCIATNDIKDAYHLIKKEKPRFILVDDGIQNPHFHKDFRILMIDGDRKFGNGMLLPSGPMRWFYNWSKANITIVSTINDDCNIRDMHLKQPVFYGKTIVTEYATLKRYFAFAGIGNPDKFFKLLIDNEYIVMGVKIFPDHYNYTKQDLLELKAIAQKDKLSLLTTRKDYVKIEALQLDIDVTYINTEYEVKELNQILSMITKL